MLQYSTYRDQGILYSLGRFMSYVIGFKGFAVYAVYQVTLGVCLKPHEPKFGIEING